jgi:hypothetical protein
MMMVIEIITTANTAITITTGITAMHITANITVATTITASSMACSTAVLAATESIASVTITARRVATWLAITVPHRDMDRGITLPTVVRMGRAAMIITVTLGTTATASISPTMAAVRTAAVTVTMIITVTTVIMAAAIMRRDIVDTRITATAATAITTVTVHRRVIMPTAAKVRVRSGVARTGIIRGTSIMNIMRFINMSTTGRPWVPAVTALGRRWVTVDHLNSTMGRRGDASTGPSSPGSAVIRDRGTGRAMRATITV